MGLEDWHFPPDRIVGERLYLCTRPSGLLKSRKIFGARLKCRPISVPDVRWDYAQERSDEVDLMLGFRFPHSDLTRLAGRGFSREELAIDESEESVYLFGQHQQIKTLHVSFGKLDGLLLPAEVKVWIDLSYIAKPSIECLLAMPAELENR